MKNEKTTGDLLARRVIAGCATRDERVRMAKLYLEMAKAFQIEVCLPKDFELQDKYKLLQKKAKRFKRQRNMLWSHASDRVDWHDGEADMSRLADKLSKELHR